MSVQLITDKKTAKTLAAEYCPIIWQELEAAQDFITPVLLGDIRPDGLSATILRYLRTPTLYYRVMQDSKYTYLLFMVYHPFDWSDCAIPIVNKLDSHRHDTETILLRVAKPGNWGLKKRRMDACCVFHKSFKFKRNSSGDFFIEAQGHGISPMSSDYVNADRNIIRYSHFDLVNFENIPQDTLLGWKDEFNKQGVNFPDQQYDSFMRRHFWRSKRDDLRHDIGDIWSRPDRVFHCAEKVNRV